MQKLKTTILSTAFILLSALFFNASALAQNYDARTDQLAINGYDVVAYFNQSDAIEGTSDFSTEIDGKQYHFASAANRDIFIADPDKFKPQYNGHCAYAASLGAVASIDPTAWTVVDDKLYLNYSRATRDTWREMTQANITAADGYWPTIMPK